MKKQQLLFLSFAMLSTAFAANAQSFVNGSFESTNANPGSCSYLHNAGFSTYTNGADTGFDTADNITYMAMPNPSISCVHGLAADGNVYIAITANTTKYDAIALKVSPALKANTEYTITFKHKSHISPPVVSATLGYATSPMATPVVIANIPAPNPEDTVWKTRSYTFKPTTAASWITMKAGLTTFAGYSFLELDNFVLKGPTDIETVTTNNWLTIAPNPAKDVVMIHADAGDNTIYKYNITDITGRSIYTGSTTASANGAKLDVSNIPAGMYIIQMSDGERTAIQKLSIEK